MNNSVSAYSASNSYGNKDIIRYALCVMALASGHEAHPKTPFALPQNVHRA